MPPASYSPPLLSMLAQPYRVWSDCAHSLIVYTDYAPHSYPLLSLSRIPLTVAGCLRMAAGLVGGKPMPHTHHTHTHHTPTTPNDQ